MIINEVDVTSKINFFADNTKFKPFLLSLKTYLVISYLLLKNRT